MGKKNLFFTSVEILVMLKTPAELKKERRRKPKNPLRTKPRNGRKTSFKKLNPLQMQTQKQRLLVPPRISIQVMTSLIRMIS
jgi:hypothetical protein